MDQNFLTKEFFSKDMLKMLYYHATRVDIADNNDKAELVKELLGDDFFELGTGTNRISMLHNNFVCKIALDRRGIVDNICEFKRAMEAPEYLTKTYECNMLILIVEYVTVMDQEQFIENEEGIKQVLDDLSKEYIFDDIGFTLKNSFNWGYRDATGDIVVLDFGYLYPKNGQDAALTCPMCNGSLRYNPNYTGFECAGCKTKYSPVDIRRRMNLELEEFENSVLARVGNFRFPDLNDLRIPD